MKKFSFILLAVIFIAIPLQAQTPPPPDLQAVYQLVQDMRSEMRGYQEKMTEQAKLIEIQGKEIAHLKNVLEKEGAVTTSHDQPTLKQHVQEILKEFRLTEREEIPEDKQLRTLYDDGFYLKGKDDTLKIGGWYQLDLDIYDRGNEGNTRLRNRRARLDVRGVLEDVFEYRLQTQFAGSAANIQEAWITYKYFPAARFRAGQFKVPFSLESQYSARWIDFVEPAMGVSNLQPAEDMGVMIFGNPWGGLVDYAVGVFNGRARVLEDNNDNFDLAGRLVLAPFIKSDNSLIREIYLGGSMTWGRENESLASTGYTTAGGSQFLTFQSNTVFNEDRARYGTEFQWIYGPGDIKAEYIAARFDGITRPRVLQDLEVDSWYISGTYILTGERKVRDKALVPKRNFSLKDGGWGAWEMGLRFEQFSVNDAPFASGIATGTDQVNAFTVGLNWWLNRHLRLMLDYVHNDYAEPVRFGAETEGAENLILARAQYDF